MKSPNVAFVFTSLLFKPCHINRWLRFNAPTYVSRKRLSGYPGLIRLKGTRIDAPTPIAPLPDFLSSRRKSGHLLREIKSGSSWIYRLLNTFGLVRRPAASSKHLLSRIRELLPAGRHPHRHSRRKFTIFLKISDCYPIPFGVLWCKTQSFGKSTKARLWIIDPFSATRLEYQAES
jgi:hypothetical protein